MKVVTLSSEVLSLTTSSNYYTVSQFWLLFWWLVGPLPNFDSMILKLFERFLALLNRVLAIIDFNYL